MSLLASCAPMTVTPPPTGVAQIVVMPPGNRTGMDLFVDAPPLLPSVFGQRTRTTVPDLLAAELHRLLHARGFVVVSPEAVRAATRGDAPSDASEAVRIAKKNRLEGAVLYAELTRWDPDTHSRPSFVNAALTLELIDPATGRLLWDARWPTRPVSAGATGTVSLGYPIAARTLVGKMTANLHPSAAAKPPRAQP